DLSLPLLPIPASLQIEWDPAGPPATPAAQAHIDARWNDYLSQATAHNKSLFDGRITRLISCRIDKPGTLHLCLGPATYKSFLVTRLRDRAWFEENAPDAMVLALGNSALLTHGHEALLGLRSENVSAYAGRLHLFGGVLEELATPKFPASPEGIIAHLRLELSEEVRIHAADLAPAPRVLGTAHDNHLGQPELFWQWETTVPLLQLAARLDAHEHTGTTVITKGKISAETLAQMTPVAREAYRRWSQL
ncbi:MAG TPA: hypothetical protein VGN88_09700, partial [Phycisphaerae bacterium]